MSERRRAMKAMTGGRKRTDPVKFDAIKQAKYLELLREGKGRYEAAEIVGLWHGTVTEHKIAYPEFAEACSIAEMRPTAKVESAHLKSALEGSVPAQIHWLDRRGGPAWRPAPEVPTTQTNILNLGVQLSPDDMAILQGLLARIKSRTINGEGQLVGGGSSDETAHRVTGG